MGMFSAPQTRREERRAPTLEPGGPKTLENRRDTPTEISPFPPNCYGLTSKGAIKNLRLTFLLTSLSQCFTTLTHTHTHTRVSKTTQILHVLSLSLPFSLSPSPSSLSLSLERCILYVSSGSLAGSMWPARVSWVTSLDRKSTRLNSSHKHRTRMPSSA